jgi:hypothetical protein
VPVHQSAGGRWVVGGYRLDDVLVLVLHVLEPLRISGQQSQSGLDARPQWPSDRLGQMAQE